MVFIYVIMGLFQGVLSVLFHFFGHTTCGILVLRPGLETAPPALEARSVTTGPRGQSHGMRSFADRHRSDFSEAFWVG